jgi:hypothetical protein
MPYDVPQQTSVLTHVHAPLPLQSERKDNRARLLLECCAILFASSQMKRLSLSTKHELGDVYLPNRLILLISVASSLESLTVVIPERRNFWTLADTVRSLRRLKVQVITLQCFVSVCRIWLAHGCCSLGCPTRCFQVQCFARHGNRACMVVAQVADLSYLTIDDVESTQQDEILAAERLVSALCCCPLLQALTLDGVYLRWA